MNIHSWFLEGAQYTLPDGTTMRAEWVEEKDGTRWRLRDQDGRVLLVFLHDGRVQSYFRQYWPDYFSRNNNVLQGHGNCTRDVCDWFVDGRQYYLPDGTKVRAILVEREDEFHWAIKDGQNQTLYAFWDDGSANAYIQEQVSYSSSASGQTSFYISTRLIPTDLTIDDLYIQPNTTVEQVRV